MTQRVALVTYSTRPRGGVVHTLCLAAALQRLGQPVHILALGDPAAGWFTEVNVPYTIVPAPQWLPTLEERVLPRWTRLLMRCATWRPSSTSCTPRTASPRGRRLGSGTMAPPWSLCAPCTTSTISRHQALVDCQRKAILEPDEVLVVSRLLAAGSWRQITALRQWWCATASTRTGSGSARDSRRCGCASGPGGSLHAPLLLAVGGIEPRRAASS